MKTPKYVSRKKLSKPVLKRNYRNNILELSLAFLIARKSQSFGGFKGINPAEVEANTNVVKLVFPRKLTGMVLNCAPPFFKFQGTSPYTVDEDVRKLIWCRSTVLI